MWRVNVPNPLKVAVTRFGRADADRVFAAMHAMAGDPLSGEVYKLGDDTTTASSRALSSSSI